MFKAIQSYYKSDTDKFHGRDDENFEDVPKTYGNLFAMAGMLVSMAANMTITERS